MPKLNKIRLGHVEYNNGHSVITDETLDFHSQSTLLRMENGGGKSVLTQMLLAPYIPPRSRNFKDRKFADYFKSPTPATILQEWVLDDNAGYFMVGMMVRQKRTEQISPKSLPEHEDQAGEENRKLDFYVFVSEYQDPNDPVSLSAFPLKVQDGNRMAYVSWQDEKKYLDMLGRDYPGQFRLYNMNNAERRRTFMERLREFGIEQTEWEQLREFNQDESGLSRFAATYNTTDKLVRQVLLPAAEKKLDTLGKASHMELFRSSLGSYTEMMIANEDTLERKKEREQFLGWLQEIEAPVQDLLAEDRKRLDSLDRIYEFTQGMEKAGEILKNQSLDQQDLIEEARRELVSIQAEIFSQKYYALLDEAAQLSQKLESLKQERKSLQDQIQDARLYKKKLELALAFEEMEKDRQKIVGLETRLEALRKTEGEIQNDLENLAGRLCRQLALELLLQKAQIQSIQKKIQDIIKEKKELAQAASKLDDELSVLNTRLGTLEQIQESYRKKENALEKKRNLGIVHSLEYFNDLPMLETVLDRCRQQQDDAGRQLADLEETIRKLEDLIASLKEKIHQEELELQALKTRIAQARAIEAAHETVLEKKMELARELGLSEDEAYDDEKLGGKLSGLIAQTERQIERSYLQSHEYEQAIHNMETGCSLDLPAPAAEVMDEMGIEIQTGAEMIKASRMSLKTKRKLVEEMPFLPYSLIVEEDKIDQLLEELKKREIHTSSIIPILSRNALKEKAAKKAEPALPGQIRFYLSFNEKLIEPEELKAMIEQEKKKLEREKAYAVSLNQEKDRLVGLQVWLNDHPLTRQEAEKAREQTRLLLAQQTRHLNAQNDCQTQLADTARSLSQAQKEKKTLTKELARKQTIVREAEELIEEYKQACQASHDQQALLENKSGLLEQKKRLGSRTSELGDQQIVENSRLDQETNRKKSLETRRQTYQSVLSDEALKQLQSNEKEWQQENEETWKKNLLDSQEAGALQAKYDSLARRLKDSELPDLMRDLGEVRQSFDQKKEYFTSLETEAREQQLEKAEWEKLESSNLIIRNEEQKIEALDQKEKKLTEKIHTLDKKSTAVLAKQDGQLDRIEELTGERTPKDRSQTRNMDLGPELSAAKNLKEQAQNDLDDLLKKQNSFKGFAMQTADILHSSEETDFKAETIPELAGKSTHEVESLLEDLRENYNRTGIQKRRLTRQIEKEIQNQQVKIDSINDDDLSSALRGLSDCLDSPSVLSEQLSRKKELLVRMLAVIEENLKSLEEARRQNIQSLSDYVRRLCHELSLMDEQTTIPVRSRQRKMLSIQVPDWEENEAVYEIRIADYIQDLVRQISRDPASMERILLTGITAPALFDAAVSISSVQIRIYKIEETRETRISWNQAGKTSGAESFLCSFVVVAAILAYQRREEAGIVSRSRRSSVMLMDNPFAKAHSPHIIEALNEMCQALNIQFIAFSAVENSAIFNAFNTIYALRMIPRSDSRNHLKAELLKDVPLPSEDKRELETVELHIEQEALDLSEADFEEDL